MTLKTVMVFYISRTGVYSMTDDCALATEYISAYLSKEINSEILTVPMTSLVHVCIAPS